MSFLINQSNNKWSVSWICERLAFFSLWIYKCLVEAMLCSAQRIQQPQPNRYMWELTEQAIKSTSLAGLIPANKILHSSGFNKFFDLASSLKEGTGYTYRNCVGYAPIFAHLGTEGDLLAMNYAVVKTTVKMALQSFSTAASKNWKH